MKRSKRSGGNVMKVVIWTVVILVLVAVVFWMFLPFIATIKE